VVSGSFGSCVLRHWRRRLLGGLRISSADLFDGRWRPISTLDEGRYVGVELRQWISPICERAVLAGALEATGVGSVVAGQALAWRKQMIHYVDQLRITARHITNTSSIIVSIVVIVVITFPNLPDRTNFLIGPEKFSTQIFRIEMYE